MFWSVVLSLCLALAIPVETKSVGEKISEQATLSTFLTLTYFLLTSIYIAAVSTDSSSSSEEDSDSITREEVIPDQSGDEVEWEFVRTGKSVEGNIYQLCPL